MHKRVHVSWFPIATVGTNFDQLTYCYILDAIGLSWFFRITQTVVFCRLQTSGPQGADLCQLSMCFHNPVSIQYIRFSKVLFNFPFKNIFERVWGYLIAMPELYIITVILV